MKKGNLLSWPAWVFALILAGLLAVGSWFYRSQKQTVHDQVELELQAIAQLKAEQIAQWRAERLADAAVIMQGRSFLDAVVECISAPRFAGNDELLSRFQALRQHYHYHDVLLVDADGQVRLSLTGYQGPLHQEARSALAEAFRQRRPALGELHPGPGGEPPRHTDTVAPFFAPRDKESEPLGAIVLQSDAREFLFPLIQSWPVPSRTAETLLIRREDRQVLFINESRRPPSAALPSWSPDEPATGPAKAPPGNGKQGILRGEDDRGVEVLAVSKAVSGSPWQIVAKIDTEEAFAGWRLRSRLIPGLMLALVSAATAAAGILWQRNGKAHYRQLFRAESARRRSEERFRHAVANSPFPIMLHAEDGTVLEVSDSWCEISGYAADEIPTVAAWTELTRDPNLEDVAPGLDRPNVLDRGMPEGDRTVVTRHGDRRVWEFRSSALGPLPDGRQTVISMAMDVTERRRTENALVGISRLHTMLSQTRQASVRALRREQLYGDICRIAVACGGFRLVWMARIEPDGKPSGAMARDGADAGFIDAVCGGLAGSRPNPTEPVVDALRSRRRVVDNDLVGQVSSAPWHAAAIDAGIAASAAYPISEEGRIVAVINLCAGERGYFTNDVVATLDEMAMDISFALGNFAREEARAAAVSSLQTAARVIDASPVILLRWRPEAGCPLEYASDNLSRWGYRAEEFISGTRRLADLIHPDDRVRVKAEVARHTRRGPAEFIQVYRVIQSSGKTIWVEDRTSVVPDPTDGVYHCQATLVDITERHAAEEKLRLNAAVIDSTRDGVVITDLTPHIVAVNRAYQEITGYTESEVLGRNPRMLKSGRHDRAFYRTLWASLTQAGHWQGEIWNRRKSGEVFPEWLTISTVRNDDGKATHYVAVFTDISLLKRSEAQLERLAHYDPLTDLPNRLLVRSRLEHATERAVRRKSRIAVLFVDLDRFKTVNDSLGHPAGDALLTAVARRLSGRLRKEDTLGRLGGDEFLVILEHLRSPDDASVVARDLLSGLETPFMLPNQQEVYIRASIGISVYPDDGGTAAELIRNADAAMYQVKEAGRNAYGYYTRALTQAAAERLKTETRLRRALERDEFVLHYQPLVAVTDGRLLGAEALVRWQPPGETPALPASFIRLAEETGLIVPLGEWVLRCACRQAKTWLEDGRSFGHLALNLSVRQFQHRDLARTVRAVLDETGVPPDCLELEITESCLLGQGEFAEMNLRGIKALGIRLSIDDFGTGYSSLAYLKRLPLDRLKIDCTFIRDIPDDPNDMAIASTIIAMAHSLGLQSLAEGVETPAQLEFLRQQGCDAYQGYLFSPPLPAEEFAARYLDQKPR